MNLIEAIEGRQNCIDWWNGPVADAWKGHLADSAIKIRGVTTFGLKERIDRQGVAFGGPLYWVSKDMVRLIEFAATSLPDEPLFLNELPGPRGCVLFEDGITLTRNTPLNGWLWTVVTAENGGSQVVVTGLVRAGEHPEFSNIPPGHSWCSDVLIPVSFDIIKTSTHNVLSQVPDGLKTKSDAIRRQGPRAFWIISQQTIADEERPKVPRATRRRLEKAGNEIPDVRVVRLRRIEQRSGHSGEGVEVDWSHRWIVSGHWRNQWMPSRGRHRLQWIAPYTKGPEDKPLVIKETVHALVR